MNELVDFLTTQCQPNDVVFLNDKPAVMALPGPRYVALTDHRIEYRVDRVEIHGVMYERSY